MLNQMDSNKQKYRIAASIICGDDVREKIPSVARLINSVTDYVDGIFIGFNGNDYAIKDFYDDLFPLIAENEKTILQAISPWTDEFAKSRNEAFALIPLDEYDWIIWLDSDDELERGDKLQDTLAALDSKTQCVMLNYVYATDPKLNETNAIQGRERIFRTDLVSAPGAGWKFDLHEVFQFPPGTQLAKRLDEDEDVYILHHKQEQFEDGKDEATRERNRRILTKMLTKNPNDTRARFYFANELYAQAAEALNSGESPEFVSVYCDKAIQAYEAFLSMVQSDDEAYVATHQIAEIFKFKQAYLNSIEADLQAVMIHSDWPDAWVGVAQSYMYLEEWNKAIFFAKVALKLASEPDTVLIREPLNAEYMPKSILATCYEQIGEHKKAKKILKSFQKKLGDNKSEELEEAISRLSTVKKEEKVPEETLREKMYGTRPEKSIAFFSRPGVEPWSTKSMDEGGIGGTETAVCEIAKRFAADGWRTVIFGTPPEEIVGTVYDGIEWYNTLDISTTEPFTVMVSLRTPELFDADIPADIKVLWMHDVNCLSGDTEVALLNGGRAKIKDLEGVETWIYACDKNGMVVPARTPGASKSGSNIPMVRVELDNYRYVDCTLDHPFMMRDGSYKEAQHLRRGDSLMPLYRSLKRFSGKSLSFREHVKHPNGEWEDTHRFVSRAFNGEPLKTEVVHHIDGNSLNNNPNNLEIMDRSEHIGLHSKEPARVEHLTKIAQQRWGIIPNSDGETIRVELPPEVRSEISRRGWVTRKENQVKAKNNHKVIDVVPIENGDVYDLHVPEYHNFALDAGVFVHNTGDNFIDEFGNNRADNIDYIVGVSDWHCSHMQKLYDIPSEKLVTLRNGINLEKYTPDDTIKRQKNKFIWSSSPDRGLDIVLELWPQIREIAPDAELHIYYGWNNFDKMAEMTQDSHMLRFSVQMKNAIESLKDQGVYSHGRISQDELANEFKSAEYWPYLSQFLETNCISILEAQAAGCIPFYSPIGGIVENAGPGAVPIQGMPMNFTYRQEFLEKLKFMVNLEPRLKNDNRFLSACEASYRTWDESYKAWQGIIKKEVTKNLVEQVA